MDLRNIPANYVHKWFLHPVYKIKKAAKSDHWWPILENADIKWSILHIFGLAVSSLTDILITLQLAEIRANILFLFFCRHNNHWITLMTPSCFSTTYLWLLSLTNTIILKRNEPLTYNKLSHAKHYFHRILLFAYIYDVRIGIFIYVH